MQKVLQDAHKKGVKFTVIVADGRPMLEGIMFYIGYIGKFDKCSPRFSVYIMSLEKRGED